MRLLLPAPFFHHTSVFQGPHWNTKAPKSHLVAQSRLFSLSLCLLSGKKGLQKAPSTSSPRHTWPWISSTQSAILGPFCGTFVHCEGFRSSMSTPQELLASTAVCGRENALDTQLLSSEDASRLRIIYWWGKGQYRNNNDVMKE